MNFLYNLSQACQNWHKHYMNMIINIQNEMGVITTTLTMTKTTKKGHKHCRCHRRRHHHHHYQALPQLHLRLPSGSSAHAVTVPFQAKGPDQAQTGRRLSGPWNHWRSIDCQPWLKTISGFREKIRGGQPSDVGTDPPKSWGSRAWHTLQKCLDLLGIWWKHQASPPNFCCEWKSPSANKNITNTPWWK